MDPSLLAGVDHDNDDDTSLAGVQGDDTSLQECQYPLTRFIKNLGYVLVVLNLSIPETIGVADSVMTSS